MNSPQLLVWADILLYMDLHFWCISTFHCWSTPTLSCWWRPILSPASCQGCCFWADVPRAHHFPVS